METKDHYRIAKKCWVRAVNKRMWYQKAVFLLGSMEPDLNLLTYLRTSDLKGHNYENTVRIVRRLMHILETKTSLGTVDYFRLGVLMHYMTDAFTLPHNRKYQGSMKEHTLYEHELHRYMAGSMFRNEPMNVPKDSFHWFMNLHIKYERGKNNCLTDKKYIIEAARFVICFLNRKEFAHLTRTSSYNDLKKAGKPDII